ncbi:MAG: alpha/beta fold hydrolase [Pseudomonadota bacterium]
MSARRLLQLVLLVQAIAALGIALAAIRWFDAGPWAAAALGCGSVALVRLLINMNNFVLAAFFASPTPPEFRLSPLRALHLLAEEFCASMVYTSWTMPWAREGLRVHAGSTAVPVLLVHGYGCNSGYWAHLLPRLERARISHATVDLLPVTADIEHYVAQVERAAEALRSATGAAKIAVVAHSMGGLVTRAWLRGHGSARVLRVLTLGTPHFGTGLANFGLGVNAMQMRWKGGVPCEWLLQLDAGEDAQRRALFTSIFSHHDNIISPQTSSQLPGARNLAFGGVGHVALGRNPRILDTVMRELAALKTGNPLPA